MLNVVLSLHLNAYWVQGHSQAAASLNEGFSSHPSLDARMKLIAEIKSFLDSESQFPLRYI